MLDSLASTDESLRLVNAVKFILSYIFKNTSVLETVEAKLDVTKCLKSYHEVIFHMRVKRDKYGKVIQKMGAKGKMVPILEKIRTIKDLNGLLSDEVGMLEEWYNCTTFSE